MLISWFDWIWVDLRVKIYRKWTLFHCEEEKNRHSWPLLDACNIYIESARTIWTMVYWSDNYGNMNHICRHSACCKTIIDICVSNKLAHWNSIILHFHCKFHSKNCILPISIIWMMIHLIQRKLFRLNRNFRISVSFWILRLINFSWNFCLKWIIW